MNLGERFKFFRQKAGLSQIEAAEKIGVKNYQLGNYETNRSEPSIATLKKMSATYHVSLDHLLNNQSWMKADDVEVDKSEPLDIEELKKALNELVEKIDSSKK